MQAYLIPFGVYVFIGPLLSLLGLDANLIYTFKTISVLALMYYFRKAYSLKKINASVLSLTIGIGIFDLWILLEGISYLGPPTGMYPENAFVILIKLLGMLLVAPFIEELFCRDFLWRFCISKDWEKVRVGVFSWTAFIITTIFFGFSHNRWVQGILTGALLGYLLYKTKSVEQCIFAHFVANLLLAAYVLVHGAWMLW